MTIKYVKILSEEDRTVKEQEQEEQEMITSSDVLLILLKQYHPEHNVPGIDDVKFKQNKTAD
jgi:hypothetical protein